MTNVYGANVLWTIAAIVGVAIGIVSIIEAFADKRALELSGKNGLRKVVARGALITEAVRVAAQLMFVVAAFLSLYGPPTSNPHNPIAYILVVAVSMMTFSSYFNLMLRRAVVKGATSRIINPAEQETLLEVQGDVGRVSDSVGRLRHDADAAYEEANAVNAKIAALAKRATESEDRADVSEHRADAAEEREG